MAQENKGIKVVPSLLQIDLDKDPSFAEIYYTNQTDKVLELIMDKYDFTVKGPNYGLKFLEKNSNKNFNYGLSSWLNFDKNNLFLNPGQTGTVTVNFNVNDLPSGGHYAAVIARVKQEDAKGSAVSLQGAVTTLVFLRTHKGTEREEGGVQNIALGRSMFDFPTSLSFRFENSGNVQLIPYGLITVKDVFGRQVAKGTVDTDSLIVLPETIRLFTTKLEREKIFLFPSLYKIDVWLHYGKQNKQINTDTSFFSMGDVNFIEVFLVIGFIAVLPFIFKLLQKRRRS